MRKYITFLSVFPLLALMCVTAKAADPMATDFGYAECQGSLMPYPDDIKSVAVPDSLVPVQINHVGRHGARYPASATNCKTLDAALDRAIEQGTITPLGRKLYDLNREVMTECKDMWGSLSPLGETEQRLIAARMFEAFRPVFAEGCKVNAISSYSPRVMMSMYAFTHQLDRMDNHMEFTTSTGRVNSRLVRPFDCDPDYKEFLQSDKVSTVYDPYFSAVCPVSAIERVLGKGFNYETDTEKRDLAITEYYVLASLAAMEVDCDLSKYFTRAEINALWSCFNLRQYLQRTATTLGTLPADIAGWLLMDIINTIDHYIDGTDTTEVWLRFGHAETLMPLLSLMHLRGCYYMTNYFDTVAKNWQDFHVVPMAANIRIILLRNTRNNKWYVRADLNEKPIPLLPNRDDIYLSWGEARRYLLRCVPIYAQI